MPYPPLPRAPYPRTRMRRPRQAPWSRNLVAECGWSAHDLVWPLFALDDPEATSEPVPSMPGVQRLPRQKLVEAARQAESWGLPAIALFPVVPDSCKNHEGSYALNPHQGLLGHIKAIKDACPNLGVIVDVALDPYTTHGHDGRVNDEGYVDNDLTLPALVGQALRLAEAGCDVVAPSDMQDGRVGAIRDALEAAGHHRVMVCAYTAKYASAFYGPFRDAVGSRGCLLGDKQTYQQAPANGKEALHEAALDVTEGADLLMVKPGMPYLDVLYRVQEATGLPTLAYQVSGEYAMLHWLAQSQHLPPRQLFNESILAFKRAGAAAIFSYAVPWLMGEETSQ